MIKMRVLFFVLAAAAFACRAFEIRTVPGFNTCSYYIKSQDENAAKIEFCQKGKKSWKKVFPPIYDNTRKEYRGSIVHLKENTHYFLKVTGKDGKSKIKNFKTRSSVLPIAETVVLDQNNFTGNLKISRKGSAKGYIRYTCAPGFVLQNNGKTPLIELDKAQYIILENMVLSGGDAHAVTVYNSRNIHISNCEVSNWGHKGVQRFDLDGKFYSDYGPKKIYDDCYNYESAIEVKWSNTVTVEKCYIHDPVSHANSWFYSHPTGPCAMTVSKSRKVVIRYNDFVGSDQHRWNDAVEGPGNFIPNGGLGFDSDVYGNYMAFANDDGIELDGGQANVRCFHNKFEQAFCGISVQGCMTGPGYVFENVITHLYDGAGSGNQPIKTNSNRAGKYAVSYIFNNSISTANETEFKLQPSWNIVAVNNIHTGMSTLARIPKHKGRSENNIFSIKTAVPGKGDIFTTEKVFKNDTDGQLFLAPGSPAKATGKVIDNFTPEGEVDRGARPDGKEKLFPVRPLRFTTDTSEIHFTNLDKKCTVTAKLNKKSSPLPFEVRINKAFEFLKVSPMSGTLEPGKEFKFNVSIDKDIAKKFRYIRGVFLIRTKDGLSRPVSVYGKGIDQDIIRPQTGKGKFISYIPAENSENTHDLKVVADNLADGKKCLDFSTEKDENGKYAVKKSVYHFDIPEDGVYSILLRVKTSFPRKSHDSVFAGVDNEEIYNCNLMTTHTNKWKWQVVKHHSRSPMAYKLKKGRHTLTLAPRESLHLDLIAITNDPAVFEIW